MGSDRGWRLLELRETRRLIVGWTVLYGVGSWLLEYLYSRFGALRPIHFAAAGKNAVYALAWAPLLFGAVWLTDRWPVRSPRDWSRLLLHGGAITAAPFLWGTVSYHLCLALIPGWEPWGVWRMYLKTSVGVLYVYAIVTIICHIAQWIRRNRDRELAALRAAEAAAEAQLQVLSLELHPHFLRNALHSVSALIYRDPPAAVSALGGLRSMLEHAVRTATVAEVSLADEMATLARYTRIQELRFGDRLNLVWQIPADVERAAIPNYLLQPLVENAIKFSVEALSGCRTVTVAAERAGTSLVVRVIDDGVGPIPAPPHSTGSSSGRGLANVRQRLEYLYGSRQSLTLYPGAERRGTVVEVRLPFRIIQRDADEAA